MAESGNARRRLLVVEDNPGDVALLRLALARANVAASFSAAADTIG